MDATETLMLSPEDLRQLEQRLCAAARPFAVATVIRAAPPTSTWVGAQALVERDGTLHGWVGGGCARAIVIQAALDTLLSGRPKRVRIGNVATEPEPDVEQHAMPCASNGAMELFIQPSAPAPVVLILGATPAALEAAVLAQRVGFQVCAAARTPLASGAPGTQRVLDGFDPEAIRALDPQLILVATQGDGDEEALEAALRSAAAGVLLIASQRKAEHLCATMRLRGIPEARLAVLHAPAGPRIHAHTPQEIVLAAVAGLADLRRVLEEEGRDGARIARPPCGSGLQAGGEAPRDASTSSQSIQANPLAQSSQTEEAAADTRPTRYLNPVCGMAVEIATAKHTIEHEGQHVYFCCDGCLAMFKQTPDRYLARQQQAAPQPSGPALVHPEAV